MSDGVRADPPGNTIPEEAIRAAAQALYARFAQLTHTSGNEMLRMQDAAVEALAAAALKRQETTVSSELRDMQIDLVKQRREKGHRFYVLYYAADGHKYWSGPHRQDVAERATAMADRHAAGFIVEDRRYFEGSDGE